MLKSVGFAERFIEQCRLPELVMLKICFYSEGIMMGAALPMGAKVCGFGAMGLFVPTYLALALKLIKLTRVQEAL